MTSQETEPERLIFELHFGEDASAKIAAKVAVNARRIYTAFWLFSEGRAEDMKRYSQTGDPSLESESGIRLVTPLQHSGNHRILRLSVPANNNPLALESSLRMIKAVTDRGGI